MKGSHIIAILFLALLWCWLCWTLLASGGGFTAKNVFVIIASGIIIFVPLYKKYVRPTLQDKKRK